MHKHALSFHALWKLLKLPLDPWEGTFTVIITVIMHLGRWLFPYRIIIFSEGALGFIGLSTEKWSSLNRLYHWQSTSPYYTGGESEKVCGVQGKLTKVQGQRHKQKTWKTDGREKKKKKERRRESKSLNVRSSGSLIKCWNVNETCTS